MKNVFEMRLGTSMEDPAKIIEVQQKISELLDTNRFRQDELKQEFAEMGAWAVPGLINSLYVYMHRLKNDEGGQLMMAELISAQAGSNEAARELIFRTGVVESPFSVTRAVALCALESLEWKPNPDQVALINRRLAEAKRLGDQVKERDLYRLLALSQDDKQLDQLIKACKEWMKAQRHFGELLVHIVKNYPRQAEQIITKVLLAAPDVVDRGGKDKGIAEELAVLGPFLASQDGLDVDLLLAISKNVLSDMNPPRHKGVEYLWYESLKSAKKNKSSLQLEDLKRYGEQVKQWGEQYFSPDGRQTLYRYWFRAAGEVDWVDYVIQETRSNDDTWGVYATLQLMYLGEEKRNRAAANAMNVLKKEHPDRVADATEIHDLLKNGKQVPRGWIPKKPTEPSNLGRA